MFQFQLLDPPVHVPTHCDLEFRVMIHVVEGHVTSGPAMLRAHH